jgi:hypothetical protein
MFPYFTCTIFTKFIYNEYIGPYFLSHVVFKIFASEPPKPNLLLLAAQRDSAIFVGGFRETHEHAAFVIMISLACVLVGSCCDSLTWPSLAPKNLGNKSREFTLLNLDSKERIKTRVGDPVSLGITLLWVPHNIIWNFGSITMLCGTNNIPQKYSSHSI